MPSGGFLLQVALDSSCVVNLLSTREQSPPDLLRLVRLAMDGRIRVNVTPILDLEVPVGDDDDVVERRGYIRQNLDQFPVSEISESRRDERDQLAEKLLRLLWPNVTPGSRKHANSLRDCKHIASHRICGGDLFVTLDEELTTKARAHASEVGIEVLSPADAVRRVLPASGTPRSRSWNPVVRRAQRDDRGEIKQLLAPIRDSYDDFDAWLGKALGEKEMWVAQLDDRIGAVAVWSKKTETTVKLATFFVGDDHQRKGLGPHLLFHQLRHWIDQGFTKVFVTVSSERLDALAFFLLYGFRIEGSSARRYKSDAVEFVLAKHLFYEVVQDDDLDRFLTEVGHQVFDLPEDPKVRASRSWFLPPSFGGLQAIRRSDGSVERVEVRRGDEVGRTLTVSELEELVYPARLALRERKAFMVPIMPHWADRMMHVPRPQGQLFASKDKLALRTDNTYYGHPYYADMDLNGAPALFYVSQPDKLVAGFARIVERVIAEPEDLFLRFDRLGVYGLEDIRGHVKTRGPLAGCAMAIRFAWWVPFPNRVGLEELRSMGLHHPQHIEAIDYSAYERLLAAGGVTW